ncbi:hypothetical protein MUB04_15535 [Acinetobacter indicus]|uniref:hypothetical protein n=1 Tax=Acinetobacter TaxID=469 RepID=UPI0015D38A47|nr:MULTISPECIES: hypothetical protein [Acinetobacter]MCP0917949.1 hypothetical protein [Acinetobacter indicus]
MKKVVFAVNLVGQTTPFIQTIQHLRDRIQPLVQTSFLTCLEAFPDRVDFIDNTEIDKIAQAEKSGNTVVHIDANILRALSNSLHEFNFGIHRLNERILDKNGSLDTEISQVNFSYSVNNPSLRWFGLIDMTIPIFKLSAPDDIEPEFVATLQYHWKNEIHPTFSFMVDMENIEDKNCFFDMKAYTLLSSLKKVSIIELKQIEFFMALENIPYFKGTLRLRLKKLLSAWIRQNHNLLTGMIKFRMNSMTTDRQFDEMKAYMEQLDQQPINVSGLAIAV